MSLLHMFSLLLLFMWSSTAAENECSPGCFPDGNGHCLCGKSVYKDTCTCGEHPRTGKCNPCGSGCFPGNSTVHLKSGQMKQMHKLKIGDQVMTQAGSYSPFIGWLDINPDQETEFISFQTSSQLTISMTRTHLVFVKKCEKMITKYAKDVLISDWLINKNGKAEEVSSISKYVERGFYSPLTEPGTLVVDNFLTSCYASFPHMIAHAALYPARTWPSVFLGAEYGTGSYVNFIKTFGSIFDIRNAVLPTVFYVYSFDEAY